MRGDDDASLAFEFGVPGVTVPPGIFERSTVPTTVPTPPTPPTLPICPAVELPLVVKPPTLPTTTPEPDLKVDTSEAVCCCCCCRTNDDGEVGVVLPPKLPPELLCSGDENCPPAGDGEFGLVLRVESRVADRFPVPFLWKRIKTLLKLTVCNCNI